MILLNRPEINCEMYQWISEVANLWEVFLNFVNSCSASELFSKSSKLFRFHKFYK